MIKRLRAWLTPAPVTPPLLLGQRVHIGTRQANGHPLCGVLREVDNDASFYDETAKGYPIVLGALVEHPEGYARRYPYRELVACDCSYEERRQALADNFAAAYAMLDSLHKGKLADIEEERATAIATYWTTRRELSEGREAALQALEEEKNNAFSQEA